MYAFGLLEGGAMVIGIISQDPAHKVDKRLLQPCLVQIQQVPYINPITSQPDPSKMTVGIGCLMLPVSWIWLDKVDVLSNPDESEQVVQAYHNMIQQRQSQIKNKAN